MAALPLPALPGPWPHSVTLASFRFFFPFFGRLLLSVPGAGVQSAWLAWGWMRVHDLDIQQRHALFSRSRAFISRRLICEFRLLPPVPAAAAAAVAAAAAASSQLHGQTVSALAKPLCISTSHPTVLHAAIDARIRRSACMHSCYHHLTPPTLICTLPSAHHLPNPCFTTLPQPHFPHTSLPRHSRLQRPLASLLAAHDPPPT